VRLSDLMVIFVEPILTLVPVLHNWYYPKTEFVQNEHSMKKACATT